MKFGKLEINDEVIVFALLFLLFVAVLHYTVKEETLKEQTKQLQIQQNILERESEKYGNNTN